MIKKLIENKTLGFFVKTKGFFSRPLYCGLGHILCFHRILPSSNINRIYSNSGMEADPAFIEKIIAFFENKNYDFIGIDRLYLLLKNKEKPKKNFIVFTLDDGFIDNYQFAYPLFKKHNIPFTIYISTNFPDRKAFLWAYMLEDMILKNHEISFLFDKKNYVFECNTTEEKAFAFSQIRRIIINNENCNLQEILDQILKITEKDVFDYIDKKALTWEQIYELSNDSLVTIGAHTVSHKSLSCLSAEDAFREIVDSKNIIESYINKPVEHFAYPYGSEMEASHREYEILKNAGFKTGTTLRQGNIFMKSRNYLEQLPRIPIAEKGFEEKLENIFNGINHFGYNKFNRIVK